MSTERLAVSSNAEDAEISSMRGSERLEGDPDGLQYHYFSFQFHSFTNKKHDNAIPHNNNLLCLFTERLHAQTNSEYGKACSYEIELRTFCYNCENHYILTLDTTTVC